MLSSFIDAYPFKLVPALIHRLIQWWESEMSQLTASQTRTAHSRSSSLGRIGSRVMSHMPCAAHPTQPDACAVAKNGARKGKVSH